MQNRLLPIGIQSFEKIRENGYVYVDKTSLIYKITSTGSSYFLSRPRRFGKSLLLSTLRAFWEGKRELFKGLAIEKMMENAGESWKRYPVLYFDLNKDVYQKEGSLEAVLAEHLKAWEREYEIDDNTGTLSMRFRRVIVAAREKTGLDVVVLVDEYDKPLLDVMADQKMEEYNRTIFKGFFSTLKSYDSYLKFVFLTGVTSFSKVSVFSDLNQLDDISMDKEYAEICGITDSEIREYLMPEVEVFASYNGLDIDDCVKKLKIMYDGYHFHLNSEGVYNPFSLLNALKKKELGAYWFETGTPTFLIKKLESIGFAPSRITDGSVYSNEQDLKSYYTENPDPLPLLYQTGYLTIKGYDDEMGSYLLGYPNNEVQYGFIRSLAPIYLGSDSGNSPLDLQMFMQDMRNSDTDSLRKRFTEIYARLPYGKAEYIERDFQNVIYLIFMLMGQNVHTELHSAKGRADVTVEMRNVIYIFEFKRDKSAEEALEQIEDKGYARAYAADDREIVKIGVNFSSEKKNIDGWLVKREVRS